MILIGNNIPLMTTVREVVELLSRQLHMEGIALLGTINYPKYAEQDIITNARKTSSFSYGDIRA